MLSQSVDSLLSGKHAQGQPVRDALLINVCVDISCTASHRSGVLQLCADDEDDEAYDLGAPCCSYNQIAQHGTGVQQPEMGLAEDSHALAQICMLDAPS